MHALNIVRQIESLITVTIGAFCRFASSHTPTVLFWERSHTSSRINSSDLKLYGSSRFKLDVWDRSNQDWVLSIEPARLGVCSRSLWADKVPWKTEDVCWPRCEYSTAAMIWRYSYFTLSYVLGIYFYGRAARLRIEIFSTILSMEKERFRWRGIYTVDLRTPCTWWF